ncbi:phenylalanine--tRNA ligase subunit beta [Natronorarus salvus]|uniref:phenylalanine--tRNA ligase subunit beta n=1 Tax=Natronorarus salvus TaxID=3117733 RepID=UPI002F265568
MPVVDIDTDELRSLAGTEKDDEELKADLFGLGLEYEGETEEGELQFEFAPDRLDRLSVEGVARSLRYHYGLDRGISVPRTNSADWVIEVEESVPEERPYVTGAIVRGLSLDERTLDSLIQLQEKLHATMGRGRAKGAIGVHDLAMLKGRAARTASDGSDESGPGTAENRPTIRYTGVEPDGERFVPLDSDAELTPGEVLTEHPTGREYATIVEDYGRMPAIYDEIGLFSFPPVINGRRTEVTTDTRELLVEMTGTDQWTIDRMLAIVCYALASRGATIEEVTVRYPDRELLRPDLETESKLVAHDRIERVLGTGLEIEEAIDCFERAGLDARVSELSSEAFTDYEVKVPAYRVDVLHPIDLVDDVGRAYGFGDLVPRYPDVGTVGGRHERSRLEDAARETLVGMGFEDLLNFHLTSEEATFSRMSVEPGTEVLGGGEPARIREPYSEEYEIVRTWALPSLLTVLSNNTHRRYPQELSEIGLVMEREEGTETGLAERRHVAGVLARTDASYEDARARLQGLCRAFGAELETPAIEHPSFVEGRSAAVVIDDERVGVLGELHPRVLVACDLELPVAAFEFDLDSLT